jgi:formate dehydrogenase subunit gamma
VSVAERTDVATIDQPEPAEITRYNLVERVVHWEVAITFIALMLSGMALTYPRLAWLSGLFGGGQTMRAAHPWIGVAFSVGVLAMLIAWARDMVFRRGDGAWTRRLGRYAREGHAGVDVGRFNAGQKGYYWVVVLFSLVLLLSGIPLWFPWLLGTGWRQSARLIHQVAYLVMVGGFIIHVYMSTALLPGTMSGMTTGKVTRRWAAWHHPRWYRERVGREP